jgi:hypothetical protein
MIRTHRLALVFGLASIAVLASASAAHAQYQAPPPGYYAPPPGYYQPRRYYAPPPPPAYRSGFVIGGAIGVGGISSNDCPACGGGFAWEGHIGGLLTPEFALMADFSGVVRAYDDTLGNTQTLSNSLFAVAAQYWLLPRLWIKGGIGDAHIDLTTTDYNGFVYGSGSEDALGFLVAGGVELISARTFALDLQLRFMHGNYSGEGASNLGLLVGLNWY